MKVPRCVDLVVTGASTGWKLLQNGGIKKSYRSASNGLYPDVADFGSHSRANTRKRFSWPPGQPPRQGFGRHRRRFSICYIDGDLGVLALSRHRIANGQHSTFEDVASCCGTGASETSRTRRPDRARSERKVDPAMIALLRQFPKERRPDWTCSAPAVSR